MSRVLCNVDGAFACEMERSGRVGQRASEVPRLRLSPGGAPRLARGLLVALRWTARSGLSAPHAVSRSLKDDHGASQLRRFISSSSPPLHSACPPPLLCTPTTYTDSQHSTARHTPCAFERRPAQRPLAPSPPFLAASPRLAAPQPRRPTHLAPAHRRRRRRRRLTMAAAASDTYWVPLGVKRPGMIAAASCATVSLVFISALLTYVAALLWRHRRARREHARVESESRAIRFLASSHGVAFVSLLAGGASALPSSRRSSRRSTAPSGDLELTTSSAQTSFKPSGSASRTTSVPPLLESSGRPARALQADALPPPAVARTRRRTRTSPPDRALHRPGRPHPGRRHRQRLLGPHHRRQPVLDPRAQAHRLDHRPPLGHRVRVGLLGRPRRRRAGRVSSSTGSAPVLRARRRLVLDRRRQPDRAPHAPLPLRLRRRPLDLPPVLGHRAAHLVAPPTARDRRDPERRHDQRGQDHAHLPGRVRRDDSAHLGVPLCGDGRARVADPVRARRRRRLHPVGRGQLHGVRPHEAHRVV